MSDLKILYKNYYSAAKRELRKNGCPSNSFDDLYNECFSILIAREKIHGITIRHPYTYIVRMCKLLWFKEQKEQEVNRLTDGLDQFQREEPASNEDLLLLLKHHYNRLSESCREVLKLYCNDYTEEEISIKLNLGSVKAVKNKKYYCKEKLYTMMINDPLYVVIYG